VTFEAKLFIQGVGCYVPHENDEEMLVLFPEQRHADVKKLEKLGHTICKHYAVVQLESRSLGIPGPTRWTTLDVDKCWIGVDPGGASGMSGVNAELLRNLPAMVEALGAADHGKHSPFRADVLPGKGGVAKRLKGGLYLRQGDIKPVSGYQSALDFRWSDGSLLPGTYKPTASGVLEVDFGPVDSFALRLRPFGGAPSSIPLEPGENGWLEVWVRHFCDLDEPKPPTRQATEAPDGDYLLTYALRKNLTALLSATQNKAPIPYSKSFLDGGKPRQCMGELEAPTDFNDPFSA
jgi:hypothetical protein